MTSPSCPAVRTEQPGTEGLRDVDGFSIYAASRVVAWTGSAASAVALPVLVYQLSGSPALTGLLAAAESLPYLLLGLHVGALVDRWDGKRVMVVAALVSTVALASVPLSAYLGLLGAPQLLLVALACGISFVFLDAAAFGTLPRVVGRQLIGPAASALAGWGTVLGVVVPGVVGVVLPWAGAVVIIAVDAVLCALSAVLLTRVVLRIPVESGVREPTRLLDDIREGLTFIARHPVIRPLTFLGFCNSFTGGAVVGLIVVVGMENLGFAEDDGRFGWIYALSALGAFVGSLVLPKVQARVGVGMISWCGYGIMALTIIGWASVDDWILATALITVEGLVGTLIILNGIVARQTLTPLRLQGRVNTTARVIAWGGAPLGAGVGGLLAEHWGVSWALYACTTAVVVAFVVGIWWRLPAVGRLADLEAEPEPGAST